METNLLIILFLSEIHKINYNTVVTNNSKALVDLLSLESLEARRKWSIISLYLKHSSVKRERSFSENAGLFRNLPKRKYLQ